MSHPWKNEITSLNDLMHGDLIRDENSIEAAFLAGRAGNPPKGFDPDSTFVIGFKSYTGSKAKPTYSVALFDDTAPYTKVIYEQVPTAHIALQLAFALLQEYGGKAFWSKIKKGGEHFAAKDRRYKR